MLSFDVMEARPGSLALVEPSSRGYETYYIAAALVMVLFVIPLAVGLLPWQILIGPVAGMSIATKLLAILYFVLALAAIVAGSRYLPRLAERSPKAAIPLTVLGAAVSRNAKVPSRLHVLAAAEDVWLTVYGGPDSLAGALRLSGQTEFESLPLDNRRARRRGRRNVTKPI